MENLDKSIVEGLFKVDKIQEIRLDTMKTQTLFQILDDSKSSCSSFFLLTPNRHEELFQHGPMILNF
jgi:hypothetical protein